MKAKILVQQINTLIKNAETSEMKSVLERMRIAPKQRQTAFRDELSYLINNYEIEGVEIGMISFFGEYKVAENYLIFGTIDMDSIGIDRQSREIILVDHDDISYVMMKCAKDSTSFLNILNMYAEFIINKLEKVEQVKEFDLLYKTAGGNNYKKFIDYLFS